MSKDAFPSESIKASATVVGVWAIKALTPRLIEFHQPLRQWRKRGLSPFSTRKRAPLVSRLIPKR